MIVIRFNNYIITELSKEGSTTFLSGVFEFGTYHD